MSHPELNIHVDARQETKEYFNSKAFNDILKEVEDRLAANDHATNQAILDDLNSDSRSNTKIHNFGNAIGNILQDRAKIHSNAFLELASNISGLDKLKAQEGYNINNLKTVPGRGVMLDPRITQEGQPPVTMSAGARYLRRTTGRVDIEGSNKPGDKPKM